jgi:mannosyl-oligosaccharide alpha-1,2-mannosidase
MDRLVKSSFDWGAFQHYHPVSSMISLPTGRRLPQLHIQHRFAPPKSNRPFRTLGRQYKVKKAFQKCWTSYKKHAWMRDELTPITGAGIDTFGGWAATLIDSLDSLWIMDLKEEFSEAVIAVASIDWAKTNSSSANVFETTIRHLGGLLSAYDLSHERVLLLKAIELGDMLYAGFDTPNRMPDFWLDFEKAKKGEQFAGDHMPSASPCSLSLEFTRLSQLTRDSKYYDAITRVTVLLERHQNSTKLPGMWPTFINMRDESFNDENGFTLGALADSLYEYLPKMHALLGSLDPVYEKISRYALDTIKRNVLFRPMLPGKEDILFSGDVFMQGSGNETRVKLHAEGQHLGCFVGGMFALSGRLFGIEEYVDIGVKVARGCVYAYNAFPTGIAPEIFTMFPCPGLEGCDWDEEKGQSDAGQNAPVGFKNVRVPSYILRPEAIESVFILYRITGEEEWREQAWVMFQAIMEATETEYGNAGVEDVTITGVPAKRDSMEVGPSLKLTQLRSIGKMLMRDAVVELLDGGNTQVFLFDLLGAGPDQFG